MFSQRGKHLDGRRESGDELTRNIQKHANCSETFYKDSLLQDIQSREDVPLEEKKQIMDMLARLQDLDTADADPDDGTDGEAIEALAALDLGE